MIFQIRLRNVFNIIIYKPLELFLKVLRTLQHFTDVATKVSQKYLAEQKLDMEN